MLHVKSWWKSSNFVIYKQFSKDVNFALKGTAFFTQLVMQASGTEQLILTSWWHRLLASRGLNKMMIDIQNGSTAYHVHCLWLSFLVAFIHHTYMYFQFWDIVSFWYNLLASPLNFQAFSSYNARNIHKIFHFGQMISSS